MHIDPSAIREKALETVKRILMERPAEAEIILSQALKAFPDDYESRKLLSVVKQCQGEYDAAVPLIDWCVRQHPEDPDNHNNLALCLANMDRYEEAIVSLEKALELKPDRSVFMSNLALQFRQIGRHDRAIELFERALAVDKCPQIMCNLGGVYGEMKRYEESERCFKQALEMDPRFVPAHVDLAFTYHLQGRWDEGFAEYEWRFDYFKLLEFYKAAYDQNKRWDGKASLAGKTILLYGEQGLGDMIQFVRYCPLLKERGAAGVVVHCGSEVAGVLSRCTGVDETVVRDIIGKKEPLPDYDYQCSLMSLPHLLGVGVFNPGVYIIPKAQLDVRKSYPETFNIGISWAGSAAHPQDQVRSTYLRNFKGIADIPGVKLFNLQISPSERVYAHGRTVVNYTDGGECVPMVDMRPMITDFDDTATVISGLDLVICVDTALVHLAGAMGVPCWALLTYNPDWRWRADGFETEWYSSVRLFRQKKLREWQPVFTEVANHVRATLNLPNQ